MRVVFNNGLHRLPGVLLGRHNSTCWIYAPVEICVEVLLLFLLVKDLNSSACFRRHILRAVQCRRRYRAEQQSWFQRVINIASYSRIIGSRSRAKHDGRGLGLGEEGSQGMYAYINYGRTVFPLDGSDMFTAATCNDQTTIFRAGSGAELELRVHCQRSAKSPGQGRITLDISGRLIWSNSNGTPLHSLAATWLALVSCSCPPWDGDPHRETNHLPHTEIPELPCVRADLQCML